MKLDHFKTKGEAIRYIKSNIQGCSDSGKANKFLLDNLPKEGFYQKKIFEAIKKKYPRADVWKEQQGAYSKQGRPDIAAVIDGYFFAFEVKRPLVGKLSKMQELTIKAINDAGGCALVVIFPDDALDAIENFLKTRGASQCKKRP